MKTEIRILFVEDVLTDAELIWRELSKNKISFRKILVENREKYISSIEKFDPDIIISDYSLPQFDGMSALKIRNQKKPLTPFILVTGSVNEEIAVECMKEGADDYILKDNLSRLGPAVINALKNKKLVKEKMASDEAEKDAIERLKSIFRIAPAGIGLVRNRIILEINQFVCQMTGYTREELVGSDCRKLYPTQEEYDFVGSEKYKQMDNTSKGTVETRWLKKDGNVINILLSSTWLYPHDHDKGAIFTALDITDRKIAEEALLEGERKYRRIFENIHDVYYETSIDGTIIEVSPSISILSRGSYDREMLIGKSVNLMYSNPEARDALITELRKNLTVTDFEISLKTQDGSIVPCSISSRIIFDIKGTPDKIIGSMRDISIRKKAEEELIKARDKAEESDRLKTAFLHNISHEIRTPMNAIIGFSALLSEPGLDTNTHNQYIDMIMNSSNHLLSIITDIIDISNIEANVIRVSKTRFKLNTVIKSLYEQFNPKMKEKGLFLALQTPAGDQDSLISADNTKLTQVLSNLIGNALKFTHTGQISFGYSIKDEDIEFFVSDTGIGISEEYHERIFDRFFQVENRETRLYEGTGLGLAISKAYVELMGGKIRLTSVPGSGTTFYFTIPYEKPVELPEPLHEIRKETAFKFEKKKKILVAEDVDSNYKLINYFLSGINAETIRAYNGQEAVDKVMSGEEIHLILMDIKMPVMDGYTAVRLIREIKPDLPIIAQTAYIDDKFNAINSGCNGFISKPFDRQKLIKAIRELI